MASGSRPISRALSEDPYSNHQLLPVPFGDPYRPAWEEFRIAVGTNSPNKTLYCSKEVYDKWYSNMQLYLLGYASISDEGKIIAVLSRLTKGDAAFYK